MTDISFDAVHFADIDDELIPLFEAIKKLKKKRIALVLPRGAHIAMSLVTLKILRHKLTENGIEALLVTADPASRSVASEAGFTTAERITKDEKTAEGIVEPQGTQLAHLGRRQLAVTPVPEDLTAEPIPLDDIPLASLPKAGFFKKLWIRIAGGVEEDLLPETNTVRYAVKRPSLVLLTLLFGSAVALLFFVIYIAVPTATIRIVPRSDPITQTVSVTLASSPDATSPQATVPAEFVDLTVTREVRIGATGRLFEGTNATGQVTLFNRSPREKYIVQSRLQSKEGLVFYTKAPVTIPPATGETPGSIIVEVAACEKDDVKCDCINAKDTCKGEFVGQRGNIPPNFFVLPAIPSLSPSLYYGESTAAFTGGTTKVTPYITQEDIDKVRDTLQLDSSGVAQEELKTELTRRNLGASYAILPGKAITVDIVDVSVPQGLVGTFQDAFTVNATLRIRGVLYDEETLRDIMLKRIAAKVHPEKTLRSVDLDGMISQIEDISKDGTIRLATTLTGVEAYDLSERTQAGSRLTSRIRSSILGVSIKDAERFIRNLPEVNTAQISSWPFWAKVIPELPENIRFSVE